MKKYKSLSPRLFSWCMLFVCMAFYLLFAFLDGPFLSPDSATYIHMDLHREPLYSLFLAFFRNISGAPEEIYLQYAVAAQSLLTAACTFLLTDYLFRRLKLSRLMTLAMLFFPLAVSLFCRFIAGRHAMYSNSIISEAVAIPLFLLFFRYLIAYGLDGSKKDLFFAGLISFLMISARKQMAVSLVLLLFVLFCRLLHQLFTKNSTASLAWKHFFLRSALTVLLVMGAVTGLDRGYNFFLRGEGVGHSGDNRFLMTMICYTAQREDAARIEDPQIRELFLQVYDACDQAGYLKHSAGEGWMNRVGHFGDHYDHIQIDTLGPVIAAHVQQTQPDSQILQAQENDRIMGVMTGALLPACLPAIIGCFFDNVLSGLVTTVAVRTPLLVAVAIAFYLCYLALFFWLLYKKARPEVLCIAGLTFVSILANVCLVSLVIFCQSRYTIYNMPLFYMSGVLMLAEGWRLWRKGRES